MLSRKIKEKIKTSITQGAYKYQEALPSIRQLASSFGASPRTVQKAINNLKDENILTSSPGKGIFVTPVRRIDGAIAFIVPYFKKETVIGNYIGNIYMIMSDYLKERKIENFFPFPLGSMDNFKIISELKNLNLSAVILFEISNDYLIGEIRRELNIPIVSTDYNATRMGFASVVHDNVWGGAQAVDFLVGKGHKRIAAIHSSDLRSQGNNAFVDYVMEERITGYRVGMLHNKLKPEIFKAPFSWTPQFEEFIDSILEGNKYSAIFCPNNYILCRTADYAFSKGIKIPEALSLIGFNHDQDYIGEIKVSYMKADMKRMAHEASDYLIRVLKNEVSPDLLRVIPMEIEKGGTVGEV